MHKPKQVNLDRTDPNFIKEVDNFWRCVRQQLVRHTEKQANLTYLRDGTGTKFTILIAEPPADPPAAKPAKAAEHVAQPKPAPAPEKAARPKPRPKPKPPQPPAEPPAA